MLRAGSLGTFQPDSEEQPVNPFMSIINLIAENFFWFAVLVIVVVSVVVAAIKDIVRTKAREATRREIAAYIAEGTMTPEQGERLMMAENKSDRC